MQFTETNGQNNRLAHAPLGWRPPPGLENPGPPLETGGVNEQTSNYIQLFFQASLVVV